MRVNPVRPPKRFSIDFGGNRPACQMIGDCDLMIDFSTCDLICQNGRRGGSKKWRRFRNLAKRSRKICSTSGTRLKTLFLIQMQNDI